MHIFMFFLHIHQLFIISRHMQRKTALCINFQTHQWKLCRFLLDSSLPTPCYIRFPENYLPSWMRKLGPLNPPWEVATKFFSSEIWVPRVRGGIKSVRARRNWWRHKQSPLNQNDQNIYRLRKDYGRKQKTWICLYQMGS